MTITVKALYRAVPVEFTFNYNCDPIECIEEIQSFIDELRDRGYVGSFTSPIEEIFYYEWYRQTNIILLYQYEVLDKKYKLDFAHRPSKTAIELDGYEWHSSREQFTKDRQRQREIERLGWGFIRFSGSEINTDVGKCVSETLSMLPR
jgi:hypothetical protein